MHIHDALSYAYTYRYISMMHTGESGDYYYILDQGSADVFIKKDQGSEIKVNHYDAGGAFGELALLHGTYAFLLLQYRQ